MTTIRNRNCSIVDGLNFYLKRHKCSHRMIINLDWISSVNSIVE
jgi:hypothetical protein